MSGRQGRRRICAADAGLRHRAQSAAIARGDTAALRHADARTVDAAAAVQSPQRREIIEPAAASALSRRLSTFLLLRAQVGVADPELAKWWTDIQVLPQEERVALVQARPAEPAAEGAPAPGRRRRRRRRGGAARS